METEISTLGVFVILFTSLIAALLTCPLLSKTWHVLITYCIYYVLQVLLFF